MAKAAGQFAPATANKMLSLLRGVLRACRDLELMSSAQCEAAVSVPNAPATWHPSTISVLTGGEIRSLLKSCATRSNAAGRRDAALLAIFLSSGLRRAEAAMLDISDVQDDGRALRVRSSERTSEHRDVLLGTAACRYLRDWLEALHEGGLAGKHSGSSPLLLPVNKAGRIQHRRLTDQAIYNMIRGIGIAAGLPHVTSRAIRLTFLVNLIAQGLPLEQVQERIGHASWVTTSAYQDLASRAAREGFKPFEILYIKPARGCGAIGKRRKRGGTTS